MTSGEKAINVWRGFVLCVGVPILYVGAKNDRMLYWFLGWMFLLLGAPYYAIAAGCLWFAVAYKYDPYNQGLAGHVILAADFVGYAWVITKMFLTVSEAKGRDEREEEARKAEEKAERVRLSAIKTERKLDSTACKVTLKSISELLSFCLEPATEMIRIAGALNGTNAPAPKLLVLCDVAAIVRGFRNADPTNTYIERVCRGITKRHLRDEEGSLLDYAKGGEKPTLLVSVLADYDKLQGTNTASQAASIYLGVVEEVANHCRDSLAVRLVTATYVGMLKPYVTVGGNSNAALCDDCVRGFELLGLPVDATEDEIRQKRRAWAEVLHPDVLGGKSERARNTGEEQLKCINHACDHIFECRFPAESA